MDISQFLNNLLLTMPVFLFSLSVHEAAHAYIALRYGDPTGRDLGRITLNPAAHIDIIGTIIIPIVAVFFLGIALIGWAKPVPVNPYNLRDYRRALSMVAVAGPVSNIILSFVFLLFYILTQTAAWLSPAGVGGDVMSFLTSMMNYGIIINVALAVFNMIPIPPLDGSKVLAYFLPSSTAESYLRLGSYGFFILIVLINIPGFSQVLRGLITILTVPHYTLASGALSLLF